MRPWQQDLRHEPSENWVESLLGNFDAHSPDTRMLDSCSGIRTNPTEDALQSLQDAGFFRLARSQCDRGSLNLKYSVCHNALGNTSSVRVDTLNGVSSCTRTHGRSEHLAMTNSGEQMRGPCALTSLDFENTYCAACTKANREVRNQSSNASCGAVNTVRQPIWSEGRLSALH